MSPTRDAPNPFAALVGRPLFWVVAIAFLLAWPILRTLRVHLPAPPPRLGELPAFSLVNERGEPFSSEALRGTVWVASFAGTQGGEPCDRAAQQLFEIQHRSRGMGAAFHLVTFAHTPERETWQALADYALAVRASPRMWSFLTGPAAEIERVRTAAHAATSGLALDEALLLIDGMSQIRGVFALGSDARSLGSLRADLLRSAGRLAYGK